jgi:hypothetical protein
VIDWSTVASLATAGGTLVLAVATFASIRSANRSARTADRAARTAERSLLAAQRPLLVNSRLQDPAQKIQYPEGIWLTADGGTGAIEVTGEVVYLALSLRNVGTGLGVLHGWHLLVGLQTERSHPPIEEFTLQNLDIYVAPGDTGLWLGALRDPAADLFQAVSGAVKAGETLVLTCSMATSRADSGSSPSSRCATWPSAGSRRRPGTSTWTGPIPARAA